MTDWRKLVSVDRWAGTTWQLGIGRCEGAFELYLGRIILRFGLHLADSQ